MEQWRERISDWISDPARRVRAAWRLLGFSLIGWPTTHVLMVITNPPENSWVFHVLLCISWLALIYTAVDILATTDVRREVEDDG